MTDPAGCLPARRAVLFGATTKVGRAWHTHLIDAGWVVIVSQAEGAAGAAAVVTRAAVPAPLQLVADATLSLSAPDATSGTADGPVALARPIALAAALAQQAMPGPDGAALLVVRVAPEATGDRAAPVGQAPVIDAGLAAGRIAVVRALALAHAPRLRVAGIAPADAAPVELAHALRFVLAAQAFTGQVVSFARPTAWPRAAA